MATQLNLFKKNPKHLNVGKWPLIDCVSKVTIKNIHNPVIKLLRKWAKE